MSTLYYFQLGSAHDLSLAELAAIYPSTQFIEVNPYIIRAEFDDFSPSHAINQLGGTVKIFKHIADIKNNDEQVVYQQLITSYGQISDSKLTIGLAELGRDHLPKIELADIKQDLVKAGSKVRYVEGPRYGLSAAVLLHKKVNELALIQTDAGTIIAQTVAVQNIDHWTTKDRAKPYADKKKGLLPPKVARMMVNLAIGNTKIEDQVLLDPFVGAGTILIEALELGLNVVGADQDLTASTGAKKNIDWFKSEQNLDGTSGVFQADATKFQPNEKINFIVTEPFLGKPRPKTEQIPNIFKGLAKLYLGTFKNWTKFLPAESTIVFAFPRALAKNTSQKHDITMDNLIDKLNNLGYITQSEPVLYHRPRAIIAREIYKFKYQPAE